MHVTPHPAKPRASVFGTVCRRPDLQMQAVQQGVDTVYVIKDPVRLRYFELAEHEFALLEKLNGSINPQELLAWFNRRFFPLRLTPLALQQMIWRLYEQGLVITNAAGHGEKSLIREQESLRREFQQRLSNPWAIRFPGINPGFILPGLNAIIGPIFSVWFVFPAVLTLGLMFALAWSRSRELLAMAPHYEEFVSQGNLFLLVLLMVLVKIFHELGHALAAYRQGCECHEIGVLLLVGMPTLFCDISDAWMLKDRWRRIAISLAGIWVELLVASAAFLIWLCSVPGMVHTVSFNLMFVCSVGTLLFNANPLLRYDGYYVLMDLVGISNLSQRAREAWQRVIQRRVFGAQSLLPPDHSQLPSWCLYYGIASSCYQFLITGLILWALHLAIKPYGATSLLWIAVFTGAAVWGVNQMKSSVHATRRMAHQGTPFWRIGLGYCLVIGTVAGILMIPLPWYILGEAVLVPMQRQSLVATVSGKSAELAPLGAVVQAGEEVAHLENDSVQQEYQQLFTEWHGQQQHLQALLARRNQDPVARDQIPPTESAVTALEHRLKYLKDEQQRLDLKASLSGKFYSAPYRVLDEAEDSLPRWTGSLLDPANQQAWIEAGDEIAQVGDPHQFEAIAVLAQDDIEYITVGQSADILLVSTAKILRGEVVGISRLKLESRRDPLDPARLAAKVDPNNPQLKNTKWYQVQIRCVDRCPDDLRIRSRGKVRILLGSRTVGDWLRQQFFRTFRWLA